MNTFGKGVKRSGKSASVSSGSSGSYDHHKRSKRTDHEQPPGSQKPTDRATTTNVHSDSDSRLKKKVPQPGSVKGEGKTGASENIGIVSRSLALGSRTTQVSQLLPTYDKRNIIIKVLENLPLQIIPFYRNLINLPARGNVISVIAETNSEISRNSKITSK